MKKQFDLINFANELEKKCFLTTKKQFKKDEVITTYLLKRNQICILLSGQAYLIRYLTTGERRIVFNYKQGDVFGEALYKPHTNKEFFVLAKKSCEVLFLPYDKLDSCNKECFFHLRLLRGLPELFINRIADINSRIDLLTNKSIRDKLLRYFSSIANPKTKKLLLPISYTDLADYLVVDRSSLMRELSRMEEEDIIKKNGKIITLIKDI